MSMTRGRRNGNGKQADRSAGRSIGRSIGPSIGRSIDQTYVKQAIIDQPKEHMSIKQSSN
eukprot:10707596-Lingulodinium_polyedra.AAC.1